MSFKIRSNFCCIFCRDLIVIFANRADEKACIKARNEGERLTAAEKPAVPWKMNSLMWEAQFKTSRVQRAEL